MKTNIDTATIDNCQGYNHYYDIGIIDVDHLEEAARIAISILLETYTIEQLSDKFGEVILEKRCDYKNEEDENKYCNYHSNTLRALMNMAEKEAKTE